MSHCGILIKESANRCSSSSVTAVPTAEGKPFKLQIKTDHGTKKVFYLGANGVVPEAEKAKAVDCIIAATVLNCGGRGLTWEAGHTRHEEKFELKLGKVMGKGFSIKADDIIEWKPNQVINFSTTSPDGTAIYAETCNGSGHGDKELRVSNRYISGFVPGVAKAIYD